MERGSPNEGRNTTVTKNQTCNLTEEQYIQEQFSLDIADDVFSSSLPCLFTPSCHLNLLRCSSDSLEPSFLTHSLQIHCFGLFEPKSIRLLG